MNHNFRRCVATFILVVLFANIVFASGHSPLCHIIDAGGGWYKTNDIYAYGQRTKFIADMQKLPKTGKPISVQVNLEGEIDPLKVYLSALNDTREYAPNRSIITVNGGGWEAPPEFTLAKLDAVPKKIKVIHDIPSDLDKAEKIHGYTISETDSKYFQELAELKTQFTEIQSKNAGYVEIIDLNEVKLGDNPDLKTFVTKEIWAAAEDELVIIIGHNEISYGGRNLRFHDYSYLPVDKQQTKSNLWFVTCNLFESQASRTAQLKGPNFTTLDKFGYKTAGSLVKAVTSTKGSVRDKIINIQKSKMTVRKPSPSGGVTQKASDLDIFTMISRNNNSLQFENVTSLQSSNSVTTMTIKERTYGK